DRGGGVVPLRRQPPMGRRDDDVSGGAPLFRGPGRACRRGHLSWLSAPKTEQRLHSSSEWMHRSYETPNAGSAAGRRSRCVAASFAYHATSICSARRGTATACSGNAYSRKALVGSSRAV